jgi:hypothetical protein
VASVLHLYFLAVAKTDERGVRRTGLLRQGCQKLLARSADGAYLPQALQAVRGAGTEQ